MKNVLKILSLNPREYDKFIERTLCNLPKVKSIHPSFSKAKIAATKGVFDICSKVTSSTASLTFEDNNIYKMLFDCLKDNSTNFDLKVNSELDKLCIETVQKTVFTYFGNGKHQEILRIFLYKMADEKDVPLKIREFKGKSCSECTERAMVAHNLFSILGFKSLFVEGNIVLNNEPNLHAYNIVEFSDGLKIYDLMCSPTVSLTENLPNPIMCEVKDVAIQNIINDDYTDNKDAKVFDVDKPDVDDVHFTSQKGDEYVVSYGDGGSVMED